VISLPNIRPVHCRLIFFHKPQGNKSLDAISASEKLGVAVLVEGSSIRRRGNIR
jgi:hypothetical protein